MIIVITADPNTGECSMIHEGGDIKMVRIALGGMCEELDRKFNDGQPPPRASGLIIPRIPPPPPPANPAPPTPLFG